MTEPIDTSLSICIVNYNSTQDELRSVISSLLNSVDKLRTTSPQALISLHLVNNSEKADLSNGIFDVYAARFSEQKIVYRLISGQGNVGFGRGHNLVIPDLQSTFHLILNPDVILDEGCLTEGINYLKRHPDTAIVSPYASGYDGKKQYLCKTYPSLLTFMIRGFVPEIFKPLFAKRLAKFEMQNLSETEPGPGIPIVSGCFMLCRTEILQKVRGFDEKYFLYFEDFDLSLRIGKMAKLTYLPSMRIRHTGGNAARKGVRHMRMFMVSAIHFFNSHGWRFFKQL